jgi:hypothetical protein
LYPIPVFLYSALFVARAVHISGRVMKLCFLRKSERRRPLEKPRHIWEDNIKMDLHSRSGLGAQTGFIFLRIVTGGGLLQTQ